VLESVVSCALRPANDVVGLLPVDDVDDAERVPGPGQ